MVGFRGRERHPQSLGHSPSQGGQTDAVFQMVLHKNLTPDFI